MKFNIRMSIPIYVCLTEPWKLAYLHLMYLSKNSNNMYVHIQVIETALCLTIQSCLKLLLLPEVKQIQPLTPTSEVCRIQLAASWLNLLVV